MAIGFFYDVSPAVQVIERRLRMRIHVSVPYGSIGRLNCSNVQAHKFNETFDRIHMISWILKLTRHKGQSLIILP